MPMNPAHGTAKPCRLGDMISYQYDRKCCKTIAGKAKAARVTIPRGA
jgi:hypothetical protein